MIREGLRTQREAEELTNNIVALFRAMAAEVAATRPLTLG